MGPCSEVSQGTLEVDLVEACSEVSQEGTPEGPILWIYSEDLQEVERAQQIWQPSSPQEETLLSCSGEAPTRKQFN